MYNAHYLLTKLSQVMENFDTKVIHRIQIEITIVLYE